MREFCYTGERLREISFPVGGIGAGCIGLAGNGALVDWEIRNHPDKGVRNPMSHFAVKAETNGSLLDARVLQGDHLARLSGDYEGNYFKWHGFGYGVSSASMAGFPHFRSCTFHGSFPTARVELSDANFPGTVELKAFSSFAPLHSEDSSLPCAFYEITFENPTDNLITYTAAFTLNPLMEDAASFALCEPSMCLFGFHSGENGLCIATDCADTHIQQAWYRSAWFEAATLYWRDFCRSGFMPDRCYSPNGAEKGTLEARISLAAGAKGSIRFALSWYYPICENNWEPAHDGESPESVRWRNYYATRFDCTEAVARTALSRWDELKKQTFAFRDALYSCSMPEAAIDAAGANLSVLVTPVCLRLEDGSFYGWEGANEHGGSCEGSCQHVWNYAYALPLLFPDLERSVRELEIKYSQFSDGRIAFRLKLPPGREPGWEMPCVDGQLGFVMKIFHHWKQTGDSEWLKHVWPSVKKAVEFAWLDNDVRWDPNRTGVLSGRQHHTLDREFFGPSSWLEGFYLGALDAAREMAEFLGEDASEYARLYVLGAEFLNEELFNGEYYSQKIDLTDRSLILPYGALPDPDAPLVNEPWRVDHYWSREYGELQYQLGDGCLLDQALAQWHMNLMGLSHPFDPDKLHAALNCIYKNNFKTDMHDVFNPCRVFCLDSESGTMICTFPPGHTMQAVPIPYCQEVMTGFEYAAASLMLTEGMRAEAETMIAAVRSRYNGANRNPWNEIECGSNYARSMAAFTLPITYAGFRCDMVKKHLHFAPIADSDNFSGLWFTGSAWGRIEQTAETFELSVETGSLSLHSLSVRDFTPTEILADGRPALFTLDNGTILFPDETVIRQSLILKK